MDFKPGQMIRCTITGVPRAVARRDTILRLMQLDPETTRGLRKAQERRRKTTRSYIRGGREWFVRQKCADLAQVETGESWSLRYTPLLAKDIASVQDFLKVEAA
jgi:hypothetical protein